MSEGDLKGHSTCEMQSERVQYHLGPRVRARLSRVSPFLYFSISASTVDVLARHSGDVNHYSAARFAAFLHPFCLALVVGLSVTSVLPALPASDITQAVPLHESPSSQAIRAPDWVGAVNVTDGGCNASMGEYTLWVYATATQCGVPRDQADRVAIIRQPLPGVSPIRAPTQLPGGRYAVWVYGAGDDSHLQLRLCAKTCITGELPPKPAWVFIDWIELRDNQTLLLRSWQQPETHLLYVQAVVLSPSEAKPDWVP